MKGNTNGHSFNNVSLAAPMANHGQLNSRLTLTPHGLPPYVPLLLCLSRLVVADSSREPTSTSQGPQAGRPLAKQASNQGFKAQGANRRRLGIFKKAQDN